MKIKRLIKHLYMIIAVAAIAIQGVHAANLILRSGVPVFQVPVNISLPMISGVAQVGQILTPTNGTWTNGPMAPPSVTYAGDWAAAIAAAPANGNLIIVPAGTWPSPQILPYAGLTIRGAGPEATFITRSAAGPLNNGGIFKVTVPNVTITDMTIKGWPIGSGTSDDIGINGIEATNLKVQRVHIQDMQGIGVQTEGPAGNMTGCFFEDVSITNTMLRSNGVHGIALWPYKGTSNCVYRRISIDTARASGISLDAGTTGDVNARSVDNNTFEDILVNNGETDGGYLGAVATAGGNNNHWMNLTVTNLISGPGVNHGIDQSGLNDTGNVYSNTTFSNIASGTLANYDPAACGNALNGITGSGSEGDTGNCNTFNFANNVTATITAGQSTVSSGGSTSLTWSTTNATACTASGGWGGSKATAGSQSTGTLGATQTFTLFCTGAGGSAIAYTTVMVPTPGFNNLWKRAGVAIAGATSPTYFTVAADLGGVITDSVIATNAFGSSLPATSPGTSPITTGTPPATVVAFPGAEGFGAASVGGRGGTAVHVTNLNDSGAGSLRTCVTGTVPRTCIFDVGGTITLASPLSMTGGANGTSNNSFLTIAGQTAPGGGIQIKGDRILLYQGVHDVVIRYIRHRRGWLAPPGGDQRPGYQVTGDLSKSLPAYNIITDHSSFGWNQDDNCTWSAVHDITFQWNLFGEPVNPSSDPSDTGMDFYTGKACLVGTDPGDGPLMDNISIHHNLIIHSFERSAAILGDGPTEFVNNVIYNWFAFGTEIQNRGPVNGSGGGTQVNIIGNNYKAGPDSFATRYPIGIDQADSTPCPSGTCSWIEELPNMIYVNDNLTPQRTSGAQPQWDVMGYTPNATVHASTVYQRNTAWPGSSTAPITVAAVASNITPVLNGAGAIAPTISGNAQVRDAVDTRLVAAYNAGSAANAANINVYPTITTGSRAGGYDTDGDGIPNAVETANGLNPNSAADGASVAGNGYTNLENYLNGVIQ